MSNFCSGIGDFVGALLVICCVAVPLGLWKLIEIIVWCCRHVHISW